MTAAAASAAVAVVDAEAVMATVLRVMEIALLAKEIALLVMATAPHAVTVHPVWTATALHA